MLPTLGAAFGVGPPSSPPSSPCDGWNDSSPASSPNLGPSDLGSDIGSMMDEDEVGEAFDLNASPSTDAAARNNRKATSMKGGPSARAQARDLQTSPAHPFSASTRADKHPPQYEKREAGSPKQRKPFRPRPLSTVQRSSNLLVRHDSGSSTGSYQDKFELFARPTIGLGSRSMALSHTSSYGADAYLHDDAVATYDAFSDDSGISGLGDLGKFRAGLMEDPEEKLWAETIAHAVDCAESTINLSEHGLTYIPPSIADLGNLVVLEGSKDPKERVLSAQRSKSMSTNSLVFGSGVGVRSDEIHLFLARNSISFLPSELFRLDTLVMLSLRGNALTEIPPQIGQLKKMRELNIANNQIKYLPAEIMNLNLNILAVDPNPFLPYGGSQASPVVYKFEPTTITPLTELCLRVLLSPVPDVHFRGTASFGSSGRSSKPQKTWLREKYDLPLHHDFLKTIPAPLLEILSACAPDCVPSALSPNVTPHASPMQKGRVATARKQKRVPCVSTCSSPVHLVVREGETYRKPIFIALAEERYTWEKRVAGQVVGGEHGVPILWRGCSFGCLDYLQPEAKMEAETVDKKDAGDDFDAQFMEVDGARATAFTSEGFEFDDD